VNARRHLLETATLISAAALCALVANGLASRERKLALVGSYPNALKVPEKRIEDSSKVTGGEAPAPAPFATQVSPEATAAAPAPAKLPIEEKRPGPSVNAATKSTPPPVGSEAKSSSPSPADLLKRFPPHNKPYVEISGDDVAWLFARDALVLDARRTKDFEGGHIALARSFPVWESDIDARVTALVGESRDGSIPVVLYCSGGDCEDSHMLAQKLFGAGFNNLLVYSDGWPDWRKRGGKSATGPES
jgi:rhodanese-related sulfurtransferase